MTPDVSDLDTRAGGVITTDLTPLPHSVALRDVLLDELGTLLNGRSPAPDGNFFDDLGADSMLMARFCARLRKRQDVPPVSMRDVYLHPTVAGLAAAIAGGAPAPAAPAAPAAPLASVDGGGVEQGLAAALAPLLKREDVPVDAHFFDDLGADSMLLARFCARVRKQPDLPSVSMKDVYAHPTLTALTAALATVPAAAPSAPSAPATASAPAPEQPRTATAQPQAGPIGPGRTRDYVLCGAAQLVIFFAYTYFLAVVGTAGYAYIAEGTGLLDFYLRSVTVGAVAFAAMCVLPIVAKWLLVGRWTATEIRIWSPAYVRFWLAKTLIRTNPLLLVAAGSPLLSLYLRLLGARIGPGVTLLSRTLPVCPDLLTIGAGTVVRKDALISGYRAERGTIRTGPVTIGADVLVGEATVIDIDTVMGDGSQLGHSSSLHPGQSIPAGESWHGTPARPCTVDHRIPGSPLCGPWRRTRYATMQIVAMLLVYLPLALGGVDLLLAGAPSLSGVLEGGAAVDVTTAAYWTEALTVTTVLTVGGLLLGLSAVLVVPRLLSIGVRPDVVYPLYGTRYSVQRTITRLTNVKFFTYLFGDSSYVVHYLRALGHDLRLSPQTGSNFGTGIKQDTPFASTIGTGTMVADGLSIINVDYSATSFQVSRTRIGANSFFGNRIAYPVGARMGENCLIATKAMVPLDGPVRENVGLLGSPSFEIPRSVSRDGTFDHLASGIDMHYRLAAKNRYNLVSMGLALAVRWLHVLGITLLVLAASEFFVRFGAVVLAVEAVLALVWTIGFYVLVERAAAGFRPLRPRFCSIYDPYFWWHERYWKLVVPEWERQLAGTPFKNVVSRMLGVRLGARVFDDGCFLPERTLVTIGDDCVLNAGTVVQCHSQEDGTFKSDRSSLGDGVTLGVGAFVHYGVAVGDGAVIGPDSFLMKGEEVTPHTVWEGNPAHETHVPAHLLTQRTETAR